MKKYINKNLFWIVLICLFSVIAIYPLFAKGFYPFHDEQQIANFYEMVRAILGKQIPPRWAPDFSFNYGHPFFNFYYLLPYYLGAIIYFLAGTSLIWSIKTVFILSFVASGITFFYFSRKFFGQFASFYSSIIYLFTPYRAVDLYVRGAIGEMLSFVFMPLVLGTLVDVIREKKIKNLIFFGLSLALLILSHNITAVVFLPFVLLFALILIINQKEKLLSLLSFGKGLILSLGLSSYYWLPVLFEKKYLQSGTPFNPLDHFPFIKQLIVPFWGYGASVWGPYDGFSFQIGLVNLFIFIVLLPLFFVFRKKLSFEKKSVFFVMVFFILISVFLMNIRSWFLWQIFPLASYVQFPWRFLMLTTLFIPFLIGFFDELLRKKAKYLQILLVFLAVILTFNYFKPEKKILVNDDYYLKRFFADRITAGKSNTVSKEYYNDSEDYIPLTIWTQKRPQDLPKSKVEILEGNVEYQEITSTNYQITTNNNKPTSLLFHSYYFPGWNAWVDGKPAQIKIGEPFGDMFVEISSGKHQIQFIFQNTPVRSIGNILSLFSLSMVLLLLLLPKLKILKK